jgi:hypothetical protein
VEAAAVDGFTVFLDDLDDGDRDRLLATADAVLAVVVPTTPLKREIRVSCNWNTKHQRVLLNLGDGARLSLSAEQAEQMALELRLCVSALADPEFVAPAPEGGVFNHAADPPSADTQARAVEKNHQTEPISTPQRFPNQ